MHIYIAMYVLSILPPNTRGGEGQGRYPTHEKEKKDMAGSILRIGLYVSPIKLNDMTHPA